MANWFIVLGDKEMEYKMTWNISRASYGKFIVKDVEKA